MRAIIEVDIPDYQIGQEASIYFKDTMMIKGVVQEPSETIHGSTYGGVSWGGTYKPQEPSVEIVKTEESNDNNTKYLNINVSNSEVERNPDIVRLSADVGILEYVKSSGDLISRQAVKDKYKERLVNNLKDDDRGIDLSKYAEEPYKAFCEFMDSIPPVNSQESKWIPVSERLPEYDEDIIITHIGSMGQPLTSISYFDGDFRTEDGEGYFCDVIAWMPLPKPYEPRESEEI